MSHFAAASGFFFSVEVDGGVGYSAGGLPAFAVEVLQVVTQKIDHNSSRCGLSVSGGQSGNGAELLLELA